jgi:hypothetical protein
LELILGLHKCIKIRAQDDWRLSKEGPGHLDMRIRSASLADSGEYECKARSARDSDAAQPVRLNVLNATFIAGVDLHHKVHTYLEPHSVQYPRQNWDLPHPLSRKLLGPPLWGLACRRGGGGVPIRTTGEKA